MTVRGRPLILLAILSFSCPKESAGKNLGVYGTTFDIREESLLKVIENKLQALQASGKLAGHQQTLQIRARQSIERPRPVDTIQKAVSYRAREYDPSFILDQDITDHEGNLIGKKGLKYNPLDSHSFGKPLLFIDGNDDGHVFWALSQPGKIVLVKGSPLLLAKTHKCAFFFDQGGILTRKLSIKAVPARVSQKDKLLMVEEMSIKG